MYKRSLRRKILIPFLLIILLMTVLSVLVSVYVSMRVGDSHFTHLVWIWVAGLILVNGFIYGLYSLVIRNITSTLDILTLVARKVSNGDWSEEIYVTSQDEVGELARVFQQMVKAIQETSQRLIFEKNQSEAIVSCMPEGILVTDTVGNLILANHRAESLFKFSSELAQGKQLLEYLNNEDLIRHLDLGAGERVQPIQREVILMDKEGKDRVYALSSSLVIHARTDRHLGIITIVRDVTHEKELKELREGFLRTVTHELRTPLTSIMGFLELVVHSADPKLTDQKREWLSISLQEATSLKNLIDDLLDLSQIRAGRFKMHVEVVPVAELLSHVVHTFLPLARGKQLELTLSEVDPTWVLHTDPAKLRRILVNLISNALKFTHQGAIQLDVIREGDFIVFSVADTGIGLKPDETEVIFEKFRQIDYSSTRQYEGIGLGLSIVKQLVEVLGGRVWVTSVYEQGSTFYFSLPV